MEAINNFRQFDYWLRDIVLILGPESRWILQYTLDTMGICYIQTMYALGFTPECAIERMVLLCQ